MVGPGEGRLGGGGGGGYVEAVTVLFYIFSAVQCSCVRSSARHMVSLKGLSHEIDFKNFDKNLQNLTLLRDAAGF